MTLAIRQFVKFAIVGAMSTAIDWTTHYLLYGVLGHLWNASIQSFVLSIAPGLENPRFDAAFTVFKAVSFCLATLNGFYFNRRWTFRIRGKEDAGKQLGRFFLVTGTGMLINVFVASQVHAGPGASTMNYLFSLACGTAAGMFWNFFGHKYWSFNTRAKERALD
ncbi:MAG: GtrA family protein [Armatimonadetes bacterium]|nr:MAG: GtrA family protein [Armatimonadota bacterium]